MFREKLTSPEVEKQVKTKVILEFMRHGEKETSKDKPNPELRLTEKGRRQADEKGKKLEPHPERAIAWGSPRKRTRETALRVMLAEKGLKPDASLDDIEEMIKQEIKVGRKAGIDERLNYDFNGPAGKEVTEAYKNKKLLYFLVNESDKRALELNDTESTTYTRLAGNISEIIFRYLKVADNFNRLASENERYKKFGGQLERYLGTHLGVVESFIAKVLEKTKGRKERDKFVEALNNQGFKETQGIKVEINNLGKEQEILLTYELNEDKKESIKIDEELLREIIEERRSFEQAFERNKENK